MECPLKSDQGADAERTRDPGNNDQLVVTHGYLLSRRGGWPH
jgi:hypothetical protein